VTSVEVTRPTLDDVFLNLTGRSLREGGAAAEDPARENPAPATGATTELDLVEA
jgi:ABC-2 type transport system ATP-binding protein